MKRYIWPLVILLVVTLTACETHNNEGQSRSSVLLILVEVEANDGWGSVASFDANTSSYLAVADTMDVTLSTVAKSATMEDTNWLDVQLNEYQASFTRVDGGTAVPNTLRHAIGGLVPFEGEYIIENLPVTWSTQKLEYPLWDLAVNGYDLETGLPRIEANVLVEFQGEQLSGETVKVSFGFPITWE